ncbi:MAG: hypothetical protein U1E43_08110 [Rhodospirillales bacterium]
MGRRGRGDPVGGTGTALREVLDGAVAKGAAGDALLDALKVPAGLEAALAALGDDVLAGCDPAAPAFWRALPAYDAASLLPDGAEALALAEFPAPLVRRLGHIGVVEGADEGERLQAALRPGQLLVTTDGAAWRGGTAIPGGRGRRHRRRCGCASAPRLEALVGAPRPMPRCSSCAPSTSSAASRRRTRSAPSSRRERGCVPPTQYARRRRQAGRELRTARLRLEQRLAGAGEALAAAGRS